MSLLVMSEVNNVLEHNHTVNHNFTSILMCHAYTYTKTHLYKTVILFDLQASIEIKNYIYILLK